MDIYNFVISNKFMAKQAWAFVTREHFQLSLMFADKPAYFYGAPFFSFKTKTLGPNIPLRETQ